ncbi:hypothetical protein K457DRAFT_1820984 [Linnemannia elongata AG-77]|uniref:Uncharacterized protein n=1 Tax=Linnemannia elongata AG-77 TaxID=1314771 RepID=A0A197JRV2_9FUNG|nr:hypothetical protein K457DRAFT_1820984 [Linnemannia elongata AG-77]
MSVQIKKEIIAEHWGSFEPWCIYYMEARLKKEKVVLGKIKTYVRERGCTAITLVAGSRKGMFPSRDVSPSGAQCGLKVRAGKSLAKIWGKWCVNHLQGLQRIGSVKGVPFMEFHTVRVFRSRGSDDIKCECV